MKWGPEPDARQAFPPSVGGLSGGHHREAGRGRFFRNWSDGRTGPVRTRPEGGRGGVALLLSVLLPIMQRQELALDETILLPSQVSLHGDEVVQADDAAWMSVDILRDCSGGDV